MEYAESNDIEYKIETEGTQIGTQRLQNLRGPDRTRLYKQLTADDYQAVEQQQEPVGNRLPAEIPGDDFAYGFQSIGRLVFFYFAPNP